MSQTVGAHILERLHGHGIRRVYGYPGDGINGILGGFHEHGEQIEFIQAAHEELAAFMACADAKLGGDVGVCLATSGPGAIHLLNGLYDAKLDHQPVVAIVGQQARMSLRRQLPAGGRPRLAVQGCRERLRPDGDGARAGHAPDRPRGPDRPRDPLGHLRDRPVRPAGGGGRGAAARPRRRLLGRADAQAAGDPAAGRPRPRGRGAQRRRARRDPDRPGRPRGRGRGRGAGAAPRRRRRQGAQRPRRAARRPAPSSPARSACWGRSRATR